MRSRSSGNNHGTGGLSRTGEASRGDGGGGDGGGRGYGSACGSVLGPFGGNGFGAQVGGFHDEDLNGGDGSGGAADGPGPWE